MDMPVPTPTRVTRAEFDATADRLKNWGKWGHDDQVGTLNYTTAEDIVRAAGLVRKGQVISLALNYDKDGPQGGKTKFPPVGRFNPVHTMLRSGSDAYAGTLDYGEVCLVALGEIRGRLQSLTYIIRRNAT